MFSSSSFSPSNSSRGDDSHDSDAIEGIEAVEAPADDSDAIEIHLFFHFYLLKKGAGMVAGFMLPHRDRTIITL